jgi:hypothetical protein
MSPKQIEDNADMLAGLPGQIVWERGRVQAHLGRQSAEAVRLSASASMTFFAPPR